MTLRIDEKLDKNAGLFTIGVLALTMVAACDQATPVRSVDSPLSPPIADKVEAFDRAEYLHAKDDALRVRLHEIEESWEIFRAKKDHQTTVEYSRAVDDLNQRIEQAKREVALLLKAPPLARDPAARAAEKTLNELAAQLEAFEAAHPVGES